MENLNLIVVFIATMGVDAVWAGYILFTARKQAIRSALTSGLIVLIGAYMTLSYLEDKRTILVAALGGMLGTYLTVRFHPE